MPISSSRFAVAVHTLAVMGYLKTRGVERASSQMLARSVNTNPVVIRNLLIALKTAGLVVAKEGKEGGASLAKSAAKISLAEIFAAVEANGILSPNKNPAFKPCPVSRGMKRVLPPIFKEVDRAVVKALKSRTLQQVIDQL